MLDVINVAQIGRPALVDSFLNHIELEQNIISYIALSEFSTIAYIIKSSLLTDSAEWSLLHPRYFIPQDACVAILALALR